MAVGNGPNFMKCKGMIPLEYASYFIFTGLQKDVESIVNVFDIGVLSTNSHVHGEGISNAILEYMALEKPVVATSGGGTNEVVSHGKTGILIPPGSPVVLAEQLHYLLNNPTERMEMGLEGRRLLSTSFSLDKMTNAYYNLYQKYL
jgi:glycosyltransferase involved in cell wall biosynthesis